MSNAHSSKKTKFQSPSLRGSGRFSCRRTRISKAYGWFQSPSLRGSGRFGGPGLPRDQAIPVSIPFIAGQWSLRPEKGDVAVGRHVSIPFIAGQWSLRTLNTKDSVSLIVSIPFIAGQWSLPAPRSPYGGRGPSFNPLHCGAVVASPPSSRPAHPPSSFNPLHCGAVVASACRCRCARRMAGVSIPFIAGQWSLHVERPIPPHGGGASQSPSLRGSGRFPPRRGPPESVPTSSQSPSLRGSGRFEETK